MWQMVLVLPISRLSVGLDGKQLPVSFHPGQPTDYLQAEQVSFATYRVFTKEWCDFKR
jgi:hypothetical protein